MTQASCHVARLGGGSCGFVMQLWLLPSGLGWAVAAVALHCRVGLSFALWLSALGSLRAAACQEVPELQCGKHPQNYMLAAVQDRVQSLQKSSDVGGITG